MQTQSKLDIVDPKYKRTIIYGIVCLITKEKYVGSTYHTLEERIAEHIRGRTCSAWQILERGNYKAYVIQHYPCNTKRERLVREGAWQRAYHKSFGGKLVNKQIEGTFQKDSPEAKRMYQKQYFKQQYEEHKEEILARNKQYNEEHKEERKVYGKQYYEEHKEEMIAGNAKYQKQPWTCNWCNKKMTTGARARHKRKYCKNKPSE
jgi:hypothetical protein